MTDPNTQDLDEGSKSKSQLKREAVAKQKLAERLVDISEANLAKMPLFYLKIKFGDQ